jgi:UDP:flavonoid glycosyltransferase YjiC (YdhE family)
MCTRWAALALELQRRGHAAVIATSESYRDKITAAGVPFHASSPQSNASGLGSLS